MLLFALLCIFSCTTEVDICMDSPHLHLAEVDLSYDLSNISETEQKQMLADSMIVVAYRVVNSWKCSYMEPVADDAGLGRYIYNKPYQDIADVGRGVTRSGSTATPGVNATGERLFLKRGDYRFITFNNTLTDEMYATRPTSGWFETEGVIDTVIANKKIELYYRDYELKNEIFRKYNKAWIDFNPYTTYISNSFSPVYFQFSDLYKLDDAKKNYVTLAFNKKTQDFEIRFSIKRESVVVDSVVAEISGVPCGMNLVTGKLDFTENYKTFFDVKEKEKPADIWNGTTQYVGNISVMGLVSSNSKELDTGPGIMQLAIHTYTYNDRGQKKTKIFRVGINMYNTMRQYGYVLAGFDEKVILEIEKELVIKKDEVLKDPNEDTSLDHWIIREDIHVDL